MRKGRFMKFISLQDKTQAADQTALAREYGAGEEFAPARIGTEHFFFKSGRKVYYLPLAAVTRCFRRVEFIDSRVGCCELGMPMGSMVICGPEEKELAQIRMAGERMGKALLTSLQESCPNAQIGYDRPSHQKSAVRHA